MRILLVLLTVLVFVPQAAYAIKSSAAVGSRTWVDKLLEGYWGDKNWEGYEFQPYLADEPIKNRILWDRDKWQPQEWAKDAAEAHKVMRALYDGGILTNQFHRDGVPYLEVSDSYLRLSNTDRIRILRFVDHVFEITRQPNGMFFVVMKDVDDAPLGTYGKTGFQQY
jgi:hypothetical protein